MIAVIRDGQVYSARGPGYSLSHYQGGAGWVRDPGSQVDGLLISASIMLGGSGKVEKGGGS